ncbi:hypothetical protein CFP56_035413 [Quercus suber]|uniref:Uncharacterized protein n=1 Tax=Quercus suber TaxID=58331 RepID=A0AAW0J9E5_QUESU
MKTDHKLSGKIKTKGNQFLGMHANELKSNLASFKAFAFKSEELACEYGFIINDESNYFIDGGICGAKPPTMFGYGFTLGKGLAIWYELPNEFENSGKSNSVKSLMVIEVEDYQAICLLDACFTLQ